MTGLTVRNSLLSQSGSAEPYRRDLPDAENHLLDTGHFAPETHAHEIGALMRGFLERRGL